MLSPAAPPHARARFPRPACAAALARAGKPGALGGLPDGTDDLLKKYGDTARATGRFIGGASGLGDGASEDAAYDASVAAPPPETACSCFS